jgi:FkbM family methyltransferase
MACAIPGARGAFRRVARSAIHKGALSLKNRQRIYNFLAKETSKGRIVRCREPVLESDAVELELNLDDAMSREWFFWGYGGYEKSVVDLIKHLFAQRRYRTVIEIGANVGYFTLLLAAAARQYGGVGATVHAFEPFANVYPLLERNVSLNPNLPIVANRSAVSNADGEANLHLPADKEANRNASLVPGFFPQAGSEKVTAIALDSYCAKTGLPRLDLVKMDCEEAEPAVLDGMKARLESDHPDILCEVLPPVADKLEAIFRTTNYIRYLITDDGPRQVEGLAPHPEFRDYFLTTLPLSQIFRFPGRKPA